MINGCGDSPTLPFLVKIVVDETVRITRHRDKKVAGCQKLVHGYRLTGKRVIFSHGQYIPILEQPSTSQAVIVMVQYANSEIDMRLSKCRECSIWCIRYGMKIHSRRFSLQ